MTTADIFRALADPTRLRIVALLRKMELSVSELAQVLGQSQPRVSRHVKILCDAGLAARRREGSWIFLTPGDQQLLSPLFAALDHLPKGDDEALIEGDTARLAAVRADRAAFASRYFADHAEDWDAIRALHVGDAAVEAKICAALTPNPLGRLVDVGTGTGRILELLARDAQTAIGIDRSPEMLRLARAKLSALDVASVELRQGDINSLPLPDGSADTVVLHQVLHYLPAPEAAIGELARILAPGGRLLVIDFATHGVEALRESDAHARLGFSDAQVGAWLANVGLAVTLSDSLPGDPLTIKIWRGEKPAATPSAGDENA